MKPEFPHFSASCQCGVLQLPAKPSLQSSEAFSIPFNFASLLPPLSGSERRQNSQPSTRIGFHEQPRTQRLATNPRRDLRLAPLGALRQRSRLGNGPRGYSPNGDAWDYLRTISPAARHIAGARTASPASAIAISSSSSPPRSGTAAIPSSRSGSSASRPRGQPRRGRQGVLLPPRQHADAFVHEIPLQVSAGRVPLRLLVEENRRRGGQGPEYELLDTGIFDENRYFDIVIEYAKVDAEDIASASRRSTAAQRPRRCTSCRTCGSATPGAGRRRPAPSRPSALAPTPRTCSAWSPTTPPSKP